MSGKDRRDDNRTRTERLVKVLQIQNVQHFQERMVQIIRRKIEFMASKSEVEKATHLELLYIAKKRPDAYRAPGVISYLMSFLDGDKIPKALLPTLFMIYGKVYMHDPYPPVIMAKILYRDVIGAQDICIWSRQDVWSFVCRVKLTYFFEPSLLSREAKLVLCQHFQPNASDVPANFVPYDAKADGGEVAKLYHQIDDTVKRIEARRCDRDALECLVFFLQMPVPRRIFIEQFVPLANEFPDVIPRALSSVHFFLKFAEPNDPRTADFLKRLCNLNPNVFPEEVKQTLNSVASMSSVYWAIVLGTKMNAGNDANNGSLARRLLEIDYHQREEVDKIKQNFRDWQPSFATSYDLLTLVLQEARKMTDRLASVYAIFNVVLMFTQFDGQLEKFAELVAAYLFFLRDYGGMSFGTYARQSDGIILPPNCAATGVPFQIDGFCRLLEDHVSLPLAYQMVCAAAKYQKTTDRAAVLGSGGDMVARLLTGMILHPDPACRIQGWIISCLLIVVAPGTVGKEIYRNEQSRRLFTEFISRALVGGDVELDINWAVSQCQVPDTFLIIMEYAKLKILSPAHIIVCADPPYMEDVVLFADITDPPPAWLKQLNEARMEKTNKNPVLIKYMMLRLTEALAEAKDMPLKRFYQTPLVKRYMEILFSHHIKRDEAAEFSKAYAPLLAHSSRVVRSATYVLNTIINLEPSYEQDESYTLNPMFELPISPDLVVLLAKVLYMDNDIDAMRSFLDYLSQADPTGGVLNEFVRRRPLLCNSLNHRALASMMATQYSTADIDRLMTIDFQMPNYSMLSEAREERSKEYHTLPLPTQKHTDIDSLPVYEPLPRQAEERSNDPIPEIPRVSKVEEEIYRCEITLHRDKVSPLTKLFTLSTLKRLVASDPGAFLEYAEPELHVLSLEYEHSSIVSDKLKTGLFYFLIVCMYRREHVPRQFTEPEAQFFDQLRAKLETMDMRKLEDDSIIADLRNHILGCESESSKLFSSIVPVSMPWNIFVGHNHLFRAFTTSLELSEPEYADQWVTKLCLFPQDAVTRPDLRDQVILPLLLSSSKDSISAFLSLGSEADFPSDSNPYEQIRQTLHEHIAVLYPLVKAKP